MPPHQRLLPQIIGLLLCLGASANAQAQPTLPGHQMVWPDDPVTVAVGSRCAVVFESNGALPCAGQWRVASQLPAGVVQLADKWASDGMAGGVEYQYVRFQVTQAGDYRIGLLTDDTCDGLPDTTPIWLEITAE